MRYVLTFGLVMLSCLLTACTPLWDIAQQMPITMGPPDSQGRAPFATTLGDLIENARRRKQRTQDEDATNAVQRGLAALNRNDDAEAMRLFRQAAAQDDARGLLGLGIMYATGRGGAKDLAEAQRYFTKAAEAFPPGAARDAAIQARDEAARELTTNPTPATQPVPVTPTTPAPTSPVPPPVAASLPGTPLLPPPTNIPTLSKAEEIPLVKAGGVYEFPVEINGVLTLNFILDSGAAEVNIPADVVSTLVRAGTIKEADFLPGKTYVLADGSELKSPRFILRSLKIGRRQIPNVPASVGGLTSKLILGQSLLEKLGTWSMDSQRRVLVLGPMPVQAVVSIAGNYTGILWDSISGSGIMKGLIVQNGMTITGTLQTTFQNGRPSDSGTVAGTFDGQSLVLTFTSSNPTACPGHATATRVSETRFTGTYVALHCPVAVSGRFDISRQ